MGYDVACLVPAGAPRGAVPGWLEALAHLILYLAPAAGFLRYLDMMAAPAVVTKTEQAPSAPPDLSWFMLACPGMWMCGRVEVPVAEIGGAARDIGSVRKMNRLLPLR